MRIIVAGAGVTGYQLLKMLVGKKHDVVVIDKDREVCEEVYAETGAMTIHGSATDIRILERLARGIRMSSCVLFDMTLTTLRLLSWRRAWVFRPLLPF
jgi:nucleoside-diphosphate-sugar epimerase